jgi:hypothetical protein
VAVWGPGATIGALCFLVVLLTSLLPETKGREVPHTIRDIESWYTTDDRRISDKSSGDVAKNESDDVAAQKGSNAAQNGGFLN